MSIEPISPEAPTLPAGPSVQALAAVIPIGISTPSAHAAATLGRASDEIAELWRTAIGGTDPADLDRLAGVSHLLRRASRLLDHELDIG